MKHATTSRFTITIIITISIILIYFREGGEGEEQGQRRQERQTTSSSCWSYGFRSSDSGSSIRILPVAGAFSIQKIIPHTPAATNNVKQCNHNNIFKQNNNKDGNDNNSIMKTIPSSKTTTTTTRLFSLSSSTMTEDAMGTTATITTSTATTITATLDDWVILPNRCIQGTIYHHSNIPDGSIIQTSPIQLPNLASYGTIPLRTTTTTTTTQTSTTSSIYGDSNGDDDETIRMNNHGFIIVETYTGSKYRLTTMPQKTQISDGNYDTDTNNRKNNNVDISNNDGISNNDITNDTNLTQQIKDAGIAGIISYALWEFGFWTISIPTCIILYRQVTGNWPNLEDSEDVQKLGAEAFAFVNIARLAVPIRIGLALSTTPWIQTNIVDQYFQKNDDGSNDNGNNRGDSNDKQKSNNMENTAINTAQTTITAESS